MKYKKVIGKIENFSIELYNGCALTFWIEFKLETGGGQGMGGYGLDKYHKKLDRRIGTGAGLDALIQIMKVCKVENLNPSSFKGKYLYVLYDETREPYTWNDKIIGIESLAVDGKVKIFTFPDWQKTWGVEQK